jgi:transcriptional regulator with XRE-family HTH domain
MNVVTYMSKLNPLFSAPPFEVEQALQTLGANLRTARLRRRLTLAEVAGKIGTGRRAVADAEKGKPSTGTAVYVALLWTYGLLADVHLLADPGRDQEGLILARLQESRRVRRGQDMDSDF